MWVDLGGCGLIWMDSGGFGWIWRAFGCIWVDLGGLRWICLISSKNPIHMDVWYGMRKGI
jgi:hypothetical protein